MADTQSTTARVSSLAALVLGIAGGVWLLALGFFTASTVFAGLKGSSAQPAFLNSLAAVAMPVAIIAGGAVVFLMAGLSAALMLFGAAAALGLYGTSMATLPPVILGGLGGLFALFLAATSGAGEKGEPQPVIPSLKSFYDAVIPLSWPIVRVACGWTFMVHGWGKVSRGPQPYVKAFSEMGFEPAMPWIWSAMMIEFVGGIAIMIGLFTRFFAAAAAIEMAIITWLYWKNGFSWLARGYEFTLLWGMICFAIALRGGGPYSLDRKLGREL